MSALPTIHVEQAERLVVLHFHGKVTLATFVVGREAIQREPGWPPSYAHIFDFTDVTDNVGAKAEQYSNRRRRTAT